MHPLLKNTSKSSKIVKYSPAHNVQQYLLHALCVGLCVYEEDTHLTINHPADCFIGIILDGKAVCAIEDRKETAEENELIFAPAEQTRSFTFERGTILIWLDFGGAPLPGYYHILENNESHIFCGDSVPRILSTLRELLSPSASEPVSEIQTALAITEALTLLCTVQTDDSKEREEDVIDRILHSIICNITDPPSVKEMAEAAGFSQAHFIRVFSQLTGLTPHQYVISVRIDRAKHLLSTTQLPLRTIATMVGYTSESMFCSAFRKVTNITAKEYRTNAATFGIDIDTDILRTISDAITSGNSAIISRSCRSALSMQYSTRKIMDAMMSGMDLVESRYVQGEIPLTDMLQSAKALKRGLHALEPNISSSDYIGSVIIGTVTGDLHDIGKNLVALMMESIGFKVIDLGVDVSAEDFVAAYYANPGVRVITISALLLSSRPVMEKIVAHLNAQSFRDNVRIIVGGGTIDKEFAFSIGADAYTATAIDAARTARNLVLGDGTAV